MARQNQAVYSMNGGAVSRLALTRVDLPQLTICGEVVENWFVSTLGWMGLRPGTQDNGQTRGNAKPQFVRFVGTASASSLLELTPGFMRIWNDDVLVAREAVATQIVNGTFPSLTGWTTTVPAGGSVTASGNRALIMGTGQGRSRLTQLITVPAGSAGKEHGLRVVVDKGPVTLRIGSTSGADDIVTATDLGTGTHSLAVTLSGSVYLDLSATDVAARVVSLVAFEGAGIVEVPTIWQAQDLGFVRYDQQGDIVFCACRNRRQQRIESRSRRSWSVVEYASPNGPFRSDSTNGVTLAASAVQGAMTVTASQPIFKPGHVGAVFQTTHQGQKVVATLNGEAQYTDPIRVTGVGASRSFRVAIGATGFTGKVTVEQALGAPEAWKSYASYTTETVTTLQDDYDNSVVYYRIGIRPGDYTSGAANVELEFPSGTRVGAFRVTGYGTPTSVSADVVTPLGSQGPTAVWREQAWSDYRGWPRGVAFQDGRLWWLGKSLLYGSVSDDFANYDDSIEGDSAPVVRSIATGPADGNVWILRLFRLIVASATSVTGVRSSSLDEPITATAFTARDIDQIGSADIMPAAIGNRGIFVGRSGVDLFEIIPSSDPGDYAVAVLNRLNPEITKSGVVKVAVQRLPEPRIWCVLGDGTIGVLTYNRDEKVIAWQTFITEGDVVECEILPNIEQDDVCLAVRRTFNGSTTYRIERVNYETETTGGAGNRMADCARLITVPSSTTTLTGLSDFNGAEIAVWSATGRGQRATVAGGQATLSQAVSGVVWVGFAYDGRFKSTKLAYAAQLGTALLQVKKVDHLGLAFDTTARIGVKTGREFDRLDPMPLVVDGAEVDPNVVEEDIDQPMTAFDGAWSTDSRFCIKASAPWPCRVKAAVISVTTADAR